MEEACTGPIGGTVLRQCTSALAFADDDDKEKPPAKPAARKIEAPAPLTERERLPAGSLMEQLEKRVADLEGKGRPLVQLLVRRGRGATGRYHSRSITAEWLLRARRPAQSQPAQSAF